MLNLVESVDDGGDGLIEQVDSLGGARPLHRMKRLFQAAHADERYTHQTLQSNLMLAIERGTVTEIDGGTKGA